MNFFIYKIVRDLGFAPNPFNGWCTLATCKPRIRKAAQIGDYVIGIGSKTANTHGDVIYVLKVKEALTFNEYWNDPRFQYKKPSMNGSLKAIRGDNIYREDDNGKWHQLDSHHSNVDGSVNIDNLKTDTSINRVLVSDEYLYLGKDRIQVPDEWIDHICIENRDFEYAKDVTMAQSFVDYIYEKFESLPSCVAEPNDFEKLVRYNPKKK